MTRPLRRTVLELFLLAVSVCLVTPTVAQKAVHHDFLMRLSGMSGRDQEKIVRTAINDQDPLALVSIDPPTQGVKIRTTTSLDRPALDATLGAWGVSIISLNPIADPTARAAPASTLPGFPVFVDTGDPVNDEAVYRSNKAAWIQAHPDLYPPAPDANAPSPR